MPPRETRLSSFGPPDGGADAEPPEARAIGVGELIQRVTRALAADSGLVDVWVKGEITGFKIATSGHWYLDLKDEKGLVSCAMWSGENRRVRFQPENGMQVLVRGTVKVYATQGRMQLYVAEMQPVGKGALHLAYEQVKAKLEAEGLFAPQRKRPIPDHPRIVGVVTSLQGAVLRDIVRTALRRNPAVQLLVVGSRVQGEGAAEDVARGIQRLNDDGRCEVIIVARGGGSMEDLWCFNDESLVRAVAASRIPVISAVGHETDFTLCDFAADHRASTPTAAAERAAPDSRALAEGIAAKERRMARALADLVPSLRQDVDLLAERAARTMKRTLTQESAVLAQRAARLSALSPLVVLSRGYAVALRDGRVVRAPEDAPVGSDVTLKLHKGSIQAKVTKHGEE